MLKIHYTFHSPFLVLVLSVFNLLFSTTAELKLTSRSQAAIILPIRPFAAEKAAAEELEFHLKKALGLEIVIAADEAIPSGKDVYFYLGACTVNRKGILNSNTFSPNSYVIKASGNSCAIAGNDTEGTVFEKVDASYTRCGTLFGVYHFLEKELGVLWLWPGDSGTYVPRREYFVMREQITRGVPAISAARWRPSPGGRSSWPTPDNYDRYHAELSRWLRRQRFALAYSLDYGHAFTGFWKEYGKDNPNFFAQRPDGIRAPLDSAVSLVQMCVSEPLLHRKVVELWNKNRTAEKPWVNANENDKRAIDPSCQCDRCRALDPKQKDFISISPDLVQSISKSETKTWSLSDRYARFYLAVQEEARKIDPAAIVCGGAYADYVLPPRETRLNSNIVLRFVPDTDTFMPGGTSLKHQADLLAMGRGWLDAGARIMLRPNYTLLGHNYPVHYAERYADFFQTLFRQGVTEVDMDSLSGQWGSQSFTLYMIGRLINSPEMTVSKIIEEYTGAFGPAASAVRRYIEYWRVHYDSISDGQRKASLTGNYAENFVRGGHSLYSTAVIKAAENILTEADAAASGDSATAEKVRFLKLGLEHVRLTAEAARLLAESSTNSLLLSLATESVNTLDRFRRKNESAFISDLGYLYWAEGRLWDRKLFAALSGNTVRLADPWKFQWDPANVGRKQKWYAPSHADNDWFNINTDDPWEKQDVGKSWKLTHGSDYDGYAWYRTAFSIDKRNAGKLHTLIFGAVDESCRVWINGKEVLNRPYPFEGDKDSWQKPFRLEINEFIKPTEQNVIAVCVLDTAGAGGIWRPVFIESKYPLAADIDNLIENGGFESDLTGWTQATVSGKMEYLIDNGEYHSGKAALNLKAIEQPQGRLLRLGIPLTKAVRYRFRCWYKTSDDFKPLSVVALRGSGGERFDFNIKEMSADWKELSGENLIFNGDKLDMYIWLQNAAGSVWFDDFEFVKME